MRILLHDCCAPCGAFVVKSLIDDGHEVVVYYFNSNIFPLEEYEWRRDEMKSFCAKNKVVFIEKNYDHLAWIDSVAGYEQEPEKGERCRLCFAQRLAETAQYASENGFEFVATTLSISPHKNSQIINEVGEEICALYGLKFLANDWKKNDGYKKAVELSKKENFHRQTYCGCEFSFKN